jgi:GTP cyclohydrolase II
MSARDALAFAGTLVRLAVREIETAYGPFTAHVCRNLHSRAPMVALVHGDVSGPAPVLARVHSSCVTSESFGGVDCDCAAQLGAALAAVARAGRGVVLYLAQEGRGAGFSAKARDRMLVQASRQRLTTFEAYSELGLDRDHRSYDEVASALKLVGVGAPLLLLTSNPDKARALADADVKIASTTPLGAAASPWSRHYLAAKFEQGHALADPLRDGPAAELPEAVTVVSPARLPDAPRFVHVARYLLPIGLPESEAPVWLRLHAHLDLVTGEEPVVFGAGPDAAATGDVPVRVQRTPLLERFAAPEAARERRRWHAAVSALAAARAGLALVLPAAPPWNDAEPAASPDPAPCGAALALLRHHLRGRRARLLLARDEGGGEDALRSGLVRHGVATGESLALDAP